MGNNNSAGHHHGGHHGSTRSAGGLRGLHSPPTWSHSLEGPEQRNRMKRGYFPPGSRPVYNIGYPPPQKVLPPIAPQAGRLKPTSNGAILHGGGTISGKKLLSSLDPSSSEAESLRQAIRKRSTVSCPGNENGNMSGRSTPNLSMDGTLEDMRGGRKRPGSKSSRDYDSEPDLREVGLDTGGQSHSPTDRSVSPVPNSFTLISESPAKKQIRSRKKSKAPPPPPQESKILSMVSSSAQMRDDSSAKRRLPRLFKTKAESKAAAVSNLQSSPRIPHPDSGMVVRRGGLVRTSADSRSKVGPRDEPASNRQEQAGRIAAAAALVRNKGQRQTVPVPTTKDDQKVTSSDKTTTSTTTSMGTKNPASYVPKQSASSSCVDKPETKVNKGSSLSPSSAAADSAKCSNNNNKSDNASRSRGNEGKKTFYFGMDMGNFSSPSSSSSPAAEVATSTSTPVVHGKKASPQPPPLPTTVATPKCNNSNNNNNHSVNNAKTDRMSDQVAPDNSHERQHNDHNVVASESRPNRHKMMREVEEFAYKMGQRSTTSKPVAASQLMPSSKSCPAPKVPISTNAVINNNHNNMVQNVNNNNNNNHHLSMPNNKGLMTKVNGGGTAAQKIARKQSESDSDGIHRRQDSGTFDIDEGAPAGVRRARPKVTTESSSDLSSSEIDIPIMLRPVLPQKRPDLPRFSPTAAWRALDSPRASGRSLSSEDGFNCEDRIQRYSRPLAPPRNSHERSGDSGISAGDGGSPANPLPELLPNHSKSNSTSNGSKTSSIPKKPHNIVPNGHHQYRTNKCWTPEQDLDESSSDFDIDQECQQQQPGRKSGQRAQSCGSPCRTQFPVRSALFEKRIAQIVSENFGVNGSVIGSEEGRRPASVQHLYARSSKAKNSKQPVQNSNGQYVKHETGNVSLRKLKNKSNQKHSEPFAGIGLDTNWFLSRSEPNSLNLLMDHDLHLAPWNKPSNGNNNRRLKRNNQVMERNSRNNQSRWTPSSRSGGRADDDDDYGAFHDDDEEDEEEAMLFGEEDETSSEPEDDEEEDIRRHPAPNVRQQQLIKPQQNRRSRIDTLEVRSEIGYGPSSMHFGRDDIRCNSLSLSGRNRPFSQVMYLPAYDSRPQFGANHLSRRTKSVDHLEGQLSIFRPPGGHDSFFEDSADEPDYRKQSKGISKKGKVSSNKVAPDVINYDDDEVPEPLELDETGDMTAAQKKKFKFQSTLRIQERKKIEQHLAREAEEREMERIREMEAMRRVEEEFQRKRTKEKLEIKCQLANVTNLVPDKIQPKIINKMPDMSHNPGLSSRDRMEPKKKAPVTRSNNLVTTVQINGNGQGQRQEPEGAPSTPVSQVSDMRKELIHASRKRSGNVIPSSPGSELSGTQELSEFRQEATRQYCDYRRVSRNHSASPARFGNVDTSSDIFPLSRRTPVDRASAKASNRPRTSTVHPEVVCDIPVKPFPYMVNFSSRLSGSVSNLVEERPGSAMGPSSGPSSVISDNYRRDWAHQRGGSGSVTGSIHGGGGPGRASSVASLHSASGFTPEHLRFSNTDLASHSHESPRPKHKKKSPLFKNYSNSPPSTPQPPMHDPIIVSNNGHEPVKVTNGVFTTSAATPFQKPKGYRPVAFRPPGTSSYQAQVTNVI